MINFKELLFLKNLPGIGKATILGRYYEMLKDMPGINSLKDAVAEREKSLSKEKIDKALYDAEKTFDLMTGDKSVSVITIYDENYPARLSVMGNKRPVLFYAKGNTASLKKSGIAVIGTRSPSEWSIKVERNLVKRLLSFSESATIISGLALGCDKIAHEITLDEGRETIAVLPSGVDIITPQSHTSLAERILDNNGCLISEYPNGFSATQYTFVERDAIVAGLSDAIYVIECGTKSGTIKTAECALAYKRPVGCYVVDIPGKGDYSGNRYLIEKGAHGISDSSELEAFVKRIGAVTGALDVQLSIFDMMR